MEYKRILCPTCRGVKILINSFNRQLTKRCPECKGIGKVRMMIGIDFAKGKDYGVFTEININMRKATNAFKNLGNIKYRSPTVAEIRGLEKDVTRSVKIVEE